MPPLSRLPQDSLRPARDPGPHSGPSGSSALAPATPQQGQPPAPRSPALPGCGPTKQGLPVGTHPSPATHHPHPHGGAQSPGLRLPRALWLTRGARAAGPVSQALPCPTLPGSPPCSPAPGKHQPVPCLTTHVTEFSFQGMVILQLCP